jgi:hypothetical protein
MSASEIELRRPPFVPPATALRLPLSAERFSFTMLSARALEFEVRKRVVNGVHCENEGRKVRFARFNRVALHSSDPDARLASRRNVNIAGSAQPTHVQARSCTCTTRLL